MMTLALTPFGILPVQPPEQDVGDVDATVEPEHDNKPAEYVVVILRGGHGCEAVRGTKPGETYVVDGDGFTLFNLNHADTDRIDTRVTHMIGLSLQQKLGIKVLFPTDT